MDFLYPFKRFFAFLKKLFFHGLFTLLPITATIFFLHVTYNLVVKWLTPLRRFEPEMLVNIPGAEIVMVIIFIMVFGAVLKAFVLAPIIHSLEKLIGKIPLIRTIYSASKTVVDFFNVPDPKTEQKKVVLVEYPRKGVYALGFLLESSKSNYQRIINEHAETQGEMVKIFMPSSPAPTTGYFLIMPRSDVIETNITFEEAIKAIVSCGLITPESLLEANDD